MKRNSKTSKPAAKAATKRVAAKKAPQRVRTPRSAAPARATATVTPERIQQMAWGYAPPLILESALEHNVFNLLEREPQTVEAVAAAANASVRGLRAIMDALVGLQLLRKDRRQRYSLTPESSAFLVGGRPGYLGGLIRHTSRDLIPKWLNLTEVVRSGRPAAAVNQPGASPEFFANFVEDIFPMSYPSARHLAGHLGVGRTRRPLRVLDLAAGSGVWGIALAQASPHVSVTAVDWPEVLVVTQRIADRFGVGERLSVVHGDLAAADFGRDHDIATLGHILHSEGEARSRALLRKTFHALAPGGTIAIAEFLVDEGRSSPPMGLLFAVNMLVNTDAGNTFTFGEIAEWLRAAGFVKPRLVPAPGPSPLILATRPAAAASA